jgi:hypothetical protein
VEDDKEEGDSGQESAKWLKTIRNESENKQHKRRREGG